MSEAKISVGCSGKHMQIHTCAVLVGHVAGCPISPPFWAGQSVGEAVPEVLVLTRRVSYSNSLPGRQARVASQLAAKF